MAMKLSVACVLLLAITFIITTAADENTEKTVNALLERLDRDQDGQIRIDEFTILGKPKGMSKQFATGRLGVAPENVDAMWAKYDKNSDDLLGENELKNMFDTINENGGETLTREEFLSYARKFVTPRPFRSTDMV